MKSALLIPALTAAIALAACSRADHAPTPAHSDVAAAMPDAASTPGAVGPGTEAPHPPPPPAQTLSDTQPPPAGRAGTTPTPSPTAGPHDAPTPR